MPAKETDKIPWNKIFVDIIGTYVIGRKVKLKINTKRRYDDKPCNSMDQNNSI